MQSPPTTIDAYIAQYPEATQELLQKVRQTIRACAPQAEECINYGIPTFKWHGNLVHFGGFKHHIGFYPGAKGMEVFKDEMANYKHAKGSVQFPLDQKIPYALITKITKYRMKENEAKALSKKPKTKASK